MIKLFALGVSALLLAIGALHLYWGFGGFWPGTSEAMLVDMVIGAPAGTPIPPLWACFIVFVCLVIPAIAVLMFAFGFHRRLPSFIGWMPTATLWTSAIVFLARGLSTYFSPLVKSTFGMAFYELDRTLYAPLCLALGVSLIFVWFSRAKAS